MRDEEAPQSSGLDLKGLIQNYGPLAAAAAGIVLARGQGGKQLLDIVRRFAPKHLKTAEESPFPYVFQREPVKSMWGNNLGPVFSMQPGHHIGEDLRRFVRSGVGKDPQKLGVLSVPENNQYPLAHSTVHEFGHLSGFERARQQHPSGSMADLGNYGAGHLDIAFRPETQKIVADEFTKHPEIANYFISRAQPSMGRSGFEMLPEALGETINDIWARRMIRNAGGANEPKFITQSEKYGGPLWDATAKAATPLIDSLRSLGRLPDRQNSAIQDIARSMSERLRHANGPLGYFR